jgi:hypothetical protein
MEDGNEFRRKLPALGRSRGIPVSVCNEQTELTEAVSLWGLDPLIHL